MRTSMANCPAGRIGVPFRVARTYSRELSSCYRRSWGREAGELRVRVVVNVSWSDYWRVERHVMSSAA